MRTSGPRGTTPRRETEAERAARTAHADRKATASIRRMRVKAYRRREETERYDRLLEAVADKNGTVHNVARCQVWCNASFLVIQLPSGRRLLYASPILKQEEVEDPLGGKPWKSRYVTYLTVRGRSWRRERAWSGLYVENIVQAIANDVLRAAMLRVHDDTLTVPAIAAYLV